jgi:hypothetical protein
MFTVLHLGCYYPFNILKERSKLLNYTDDHVFVSNIPTARVLVQLHLKILMLLSHEPKCTVLITTVLEYFKCEMMMMMMFVCLFIFLLLFVIYFILFYF